MKENHQSVYFLKDLSVEEEFNLIFKEQPKIDKSEEKLIFGNKLLPTSQNFQNTKFNLEKSQKCPNSLTELIILSLLSNSVFYNMIETAYEKINHKLVYTPFLNRLKSSIENLENLEVQDIAIDHLSIYRGIIRKSHDDFILTHFFEQENWNENTKKVYKFDKKLFEKYSPIVEIFHGAFEGSDRFNQPFKIMKDTIQIESLNDRGSDLNECIQTSLDNENLKFIKYPLILTISCDPAQNVRLRPEIIINKKKYILNSFITKNNTIYEAYIKSKDWVVCREGEVHDGGDVLEKSHNIILAFYQISKMIN